jgi:hypothetical protein
MFKLGHVGCLDDAGSPGELYFRDLEVAGSPLSLGIVKDDFLTASVSCDYTYPSEITVSCNLFSIVEVDHPDYGNNLEMVYVSPVRSNTL